ncbi:MAG: acyl-CoA dehydrogenase family protein [Acidimicrobiales bacterium]
MHSRGGNLLTITDAPEQAESAELAEWRERVRGWLEANAARRRQKTEEELVARVTATAETDDGDGVARSKAFQAKLYDAGFVGITWPVEYGGQGLTKRHQEIFNAEAAGYELPTGIYTIGLGMVIPTVLEFGTEELKQRYIPKALRGEEVWSQLFSEPGAGSDVASLQMRAVLDGEEWVLNGQKVWTTGAQYSEYGAVIARTDPDAPKHKGISMFVVDLKSPGVEIRPLRQITGGASFNEVFFTDVRVPADHIVGERNDGWRCAIAMLMNERVAIGAGGGAGASGGGNRLAGFNAMVKVANDNGAIGDATIRQGLADVYIRQRIMGFIGLRIRAAAQAGLAPGPEGSIAKLSGAYLARISSDLGIAIAGAAGQAWDPDDEVGNRWAMTVLSAPSSAIAGGTNEVQKNIIGERVLALPKEPQVDRDMPFKDLAVGTQGLPGT